MKQLSLCLFFIVLQLSSFAKEYYVDLSAHYLLINSFDYYVEQVIDASAEKGCIGFVQVGGKNVIYPAYFKKGTEGELTAFFARNLAKSVTKKPLILRINKIFIHEYIYGSKEIATASISLTFFGKEGEHYQELLTTCEVLQKSGGMMDVTQSHNLNIANCLTACFKTLKVRLNANKIIPKLVPDSTIYINSFINSDFPISREPKGRYGIYYTYSDFLYNTPDTTTKFKVGYNQIDSIKGQIAAFKYLDKKNKTPIWGFWDGNNIYAKQGEDEYYPLMFEKGEYYIWMYNQPPNNQMIDGDLAAASIFLSAIGIMAGAGAIILFRVPGVSNNNTPRERIKFYLDYPTSEFLPKEQVFKPKATTRICNSTFNREGEEIEVWIKGKKEAVLPVGTYFDWTSGLEVQNAEIVLKNKVDSQTIVFEPQVPLTNYLLCKLNKKGEIREKWLNDTETDIIIINEIKTNKMKKISP